MIAITGATGKLGRLVIETLLKTQAASSIIAAVRNVDAASDLAKLGVIVRYADYNKPNTLDIAFEGVEKILLISSSEVGQRVTQHNAVIQAAKKADVKLIAYTSLLRADKSELKLAAEHVATENDLKASGIPYTLLRHGWYFENYSDGFPTALEHGVVMGSTVNGKVSPATRLNYAEAAAAVLTSSDDQAGKIYELAGDNGFTLTEMAAEIAKQSNQEIKYIDRPEATFATELEKFGFPKPFAADIADADVGISNGWLFDDGKVLSKLIGHPTTTLAQVVAAKLKG